MKNPRCDLHLWNFLSILERFFSLSFLYIQEKRSTCSTWKKNLCCYHMVTKNSILFFSLHIQTSCVVCFLSPNVCPCLLDTFCLVLAFRCHVFFIYIYLFNPHFSFILSTLLPFPLSMHSQLAVSTHSFLHTNSGGTLISLSSVRKRNLIVWK